MIFSCLFTFQYMKNKSLFLFIDDNCCGCNYAVFTKMCHLPDTYLVYMTYHVDVAETPFMVVLDYTQKAIVISIRGTLSLEV